jgi:hypothetical protein
MTADSRLRRMVSQAATGSRVAKPGAICRSWLSRARVVRRMAVHRARATSIA